MRVEEVSIVIENLKGEGKRRDNCRCRGGRSK